MVKIKATILGLITLVFSAFGALVVSGAVTTTPSSSVVYAATTPTTPTTPTNPTEITDWESVYEYTVTNGEVTITRIKPAYNTYYHFTIPATISGYPVVNVNIYHDNITTVNFMPDASGNYYLRKIGALCGPKLENITCNNGTQFQLPNTLTTIGDGAFENAKFTTFVMPDSVTSVGEGALGNSSQLTSLTLSANLNISSGQYFDTLFNYNGSINAPKLQEIHVGSGSSYLAELGGVLYSSDYSTLIKVPYGYDSKIFNINNNVNIISIGAFQYNSTIETVNFGLNVDLIQYMAFAYCRALTTVSLNNTITTIEAYAFNNCKALVTINLPESIQLSEVPDWNGGCRFMFHNCESLKSVIIPNSWTYIPYDMFLGCTSLVSVQWGNNITTICEAAFNNCAKLTSIGDMSNVTDIDSDAFNGCRSLSDLGNISSVQNIGRSAFYNCKALKSLTLPSDVTLATGFASGAGIENYYITGSRTYTAVDGVLYTNNGSTLFAFPAGRTGTFAIPSGTTTIGDNAFAGSSITTFTHDDTLGNIGNHAFEGSKISILDLTEVVNIGGWAFSYCNNLVSITIPTSVEGTQNDTFSGCANLREVVFEEGTSVTELYHTFSDCLSLRSLTLAEGIVTLDNFIVTHTYDQMHLPYLLIPASVKHYCSTGSYNPATIDTLEFASGSTTFTKSDRYSEPFTGYSNNVIIPSTMTHVDELHFQIVEIRGSVTEGTRSEIFTVDTLWGTTKILVPASDLELYKASPAWSGYTSQLVTSLDVNVTFVNHIGTTFDAQTVGYGATAINPGTPTSTYPQAVFSGWYIMQDGAYTLFDFSTPLYNNITLTALWEGVGTEIYLTYNQLADGTYEITGYTPELNDFSTLTIPATTPSGGVISSIATNAFANTGYQDLSNIQKVVFAPDAHISIGRRAFYNMNFTQLDLGGVVSIGNNAFQNCSKLKKLHIPASVNYIGDNAFSNCTRLTELTWDSLDTIEYETNASGVQWVKSGVLMGELQSIIANDGTHINAVYSTYPILTAEVNIRPNLGQHIFVNCHWLRKVQLPNHMYVIPGRMFANCEQLTEVTFPTNLDCIGANAFTHCSALTNVTLPDNLQKIKKGAFSYTNLNAITIPINVYEISENPFIGCHNLRSIEVDPLNETYISIDGILFNYSYGMELLSLVSYPEAKGKSVDLVKLETEYDARIDCIYDYAFADNTTLQMINLPTGTGSTYFKIRQNAFDGCYMLAAVTFNSTGVNFCVSGTSTGYSYNVFRGCDSLNTILFNTIQETVYDIVPQIFEGLDPSQINVYVRRENMQDFENSMWSMFNLMSVTQADQLCIVILDNRGGEGISSVVMEKGSLLRIVNPTKLGYVFNGWYDTDTGSEITATTPIDKTMMLYADWVLRDYDLVYMLNGGTVIGSTDTTQAQSVFHITDVMDADGNSINMRLAVPSRYGWQFDGWYTNSEFTSAKLQFLSLDTMNVAQLNGSVPVTLHAKWIQITYNVTFASGTGYVVGLAPDSANPVGHGSTLKFTLLFGEGYTQNTPDNLTVTARNVGDGSTTTVTATNIDGVWYYTIEDVTSDYEISIAGVKLNVYNVYFASQVTAVDSTISDMPTHMTITHGKSIREALGDTGTISTPSKAGYNFVDWFRQVYNAETGMTELEYLKYNFATPITEETTLCATWSAQEYTVTFVLNGGLMSVTSMKYNIESEFLLPYNTDFTKNITRDGYTFGGWFDNEALTGDEVTQVSKGTTGDLTFYAKWNAVPYTITYNLNDGTIPGTYPTEYTIEQEVELPTPVRGGYTFGGWSDNADTALGNILHRIELGSTGNKVLYAVWVSNVYTIEYNLCGNEYAPVAVNGVIISSTSNYYKEQFVYGDQPELLSIIERRGYTFDGWYTTSDYQEGTKLTSVGTEVDYNIVLYAKWNAVTFTVNLDYNNGGLTPSAQIVFTFDQFNTNGGVLGLPNDVTWDEHHYFMGWYDGATKYSAITPDNAGNLTLVAKWSENQFNITILPTASCDTSDLNSAIRVVGGDGDIVKNFGGDIRFMVLITDSKYSKSDISIQYRIGEGALTEISADASGYFEITGITGDLTIYIQNLKINTYTVSFESNGGSSVGSMVNITHGNTISAPEAPTRPGYVFSAWTIAGGAEFKFDTAITSDLTLYAKWDASPLTVTVVSDITGATLAEWAFDVTTLKVFDAMSDIDGYQFSHYTYNGVAISSTSGLTESVTIVAKYNIITYNVYYSLDNAYIETGNPNTFNINGASYVDEHGNAQFGIATLKGATKEGYNFNGWFDRETNVRVTTIPFEIDGQKVLRDVVLVANFSLMSENYWEVTFNDGNRVLDRVSVLKGNAVSVYSAGDKLGYTNTNEWYTNNSFTGTPWNFADVVTGNMDLYIKYDVTEYTISYEYRVNDASYVVNKVITDAVVTNDNVTTYTIEDRILLSAPAIEGYTFSGWTFNGADITEINAMYGNITLVANFEYITYNVMYSIEAGAQNDPNNITSFKVDDEKFTLNDAVAISGYHFVKWVVTTDKNIVVTAIDPSLATDYYLTAVFEPDIVYVGITLYIDGTYVSYVQNEIDTLFSEPVFTRSGYRLSGWYMDKAYTEPFDFNTVTTSDMTLYAKYDLVTYNISYDANIAISQSYPEVTTFTAEQVATLPNLSDEKGYRFVGWYIDVPKVNGVYDFDSAIPLSNTTNNIYKDITAVARFDEKVYTVTYELNGGVNHADNINEFTINTPTFVLLTASKEGYNFLGWTRQIDGEYVRVYNIPMGTAEDIVLRANWELIPTSISVTRKVQRGSSSTFYISSIDEYSLVDGATMIPRNEIVLDGYVFDGWYLNEEMTVLFNLNIQYSTDQVMYARMLPKQFSINYVYSVGGTQTATNPTTYTVEDLVVLRSPQTIAGYNFDAWYVGVTDNDGVLNFDSATKVTSINQQTGDITLYARYTLVTYRINYFLDGGTNNASNPTSFTVLSDDIVLFDAIAPEGYVFVGWKDNSGRYVKSISKGYVGDILLTAEYSKVEQETKILDSNRLMIIVISVASVAVLFGAIIVIAVIKNNKRKSLDSKRIATLIQQINTVANRRNDNNDKHDNM